MNEITKTFIDNNGVYSEAIYSNDLMHRYSLKRIWDKDKDVITWIMLNPSTATELVNDPTIERCIIRAKSYGFGSCQILNLFAFRATNPHELKVQVEPIGESNNDFILSECSNAGKIICAWGNHGTLANRSEEVLNLIKDFDLYYLRLTSIGQPSHPLYISYEIKPKPCYVLNGKLEHDFHRSFVLY